MFLIDPDIIASPSNFDSATVSTNLGSTNITIFSLSDISFNNANVSWTSTNTLSLIANDDISIDGNSSIIGENGTLIIDANNNISPFGDISVAKFVLTDGFWNQSVDFSSLTSLPSFSADDFTITSGTFERFAGGNGSSSNPYQLVDVYGLQGIGSANSLLTDNYKLNNDIDASSTVNWNSGSGFYPIAATGDDFSGTIDGDNGSGGVYIISGLYIDRPDLDRAGFIGLGRNELILENLGFEDVYIRGDDEIGLVGKLDDAFINNVYVTGRVHGDSGSNTVGGLVGHADDDSEILNSYANVLVSGDEEVGGLVGLLSDSDITQSYSLGDVNGSSSSENVGGLVGRSGAGSRIYDSYALGNVSGNSNIGGFIGNDNPDIFDFNEFENNYSLGRVTGSNNVGGFVGRTDFGVGFNNNYWNEATAGVTRDAGNDNSVPGVSVLTTTNMMKQNSWRGFDFGNGGGDEWLINENLSLSYHKWLYSSTPVAISGKVYSTSDNTTEAVGADIIVASATDDLINTSTYADGFYYGLIDPDKILAGDHLTAYEATGSTSGQHIFVPDKASGGDIVDVFKNKLSFSGYNNLLEHTEVYNLSGVSPVLSKGSLNVIELANNIDFIIPSGIEYEFSANGEIIVNGVDITFNGPVEISNGVEAILTQNSSSTNTDFNILDGFVGNNGTLTVNGNGGDDNLILDLDNTNNLPSSIVYNGAGQSSSDILTLQNSSSFSSITYGYDNENDGDIVLVGSSTSTIEYNGLEPIVDNFSAANRTFTFSDVVQTITLNDHSGSNDNVSLIDSTIGEIVYFTSPTTSLTINGGSNVDTINISDLDDQFMASLNVNGQGGSPDAINLANIPGTVNNLNLTAENINITAGSVATTGSQVYNGVLDLPNLISFTTTGSSKNITFSQAVNDPSSDVTISATGDIFADDFTVDEFTLSNGSWEQIVGDTPGLTSLPIFSVNDFTLTGGTYKRFAGGDGTSSSPYQIVDIYGLQGIGSPSNSLLNKHYKLNNDIDASSTSNWNGGAGFDPIGSSSNTFTGVLNGNNGSGGGYVIRDLYIDRPSSDRIGLISYSNNTPNGFDTVSNIGLENVDITGDDEVGGLVGFANDSSFDNVYVTGSVTGDEFIGGLIGEILRSTVDNSWTNVELNADFVGGGLIGYVTRESSVNQSYAIGNVSLTDDYAGGLVGVADEDIIINESYATGDVLGLDRVGGLIGAVFVFDNFTLTNNYALGNVSGNNDIGGFIGELDVFDFFGDDISNNYSIGRVTGNSNVGGFIGDSNIVVGGSLSSDNYWNTETSGLTNAVGSGGSSGITGLTTANMMSQSTFSNWDFANDWGINEGLSFPYHKWRHPLTPVAVSGKIYSSADNSTIAVGAGINIDSVSENLLSSESYSDGFYYTLIENGLLSVGEYITSYEITGNISGQHIFVPDVVNGGILDVDLFKNTLSVSSFNNLLEHTKVYSLSSNSVLLSQGPSNEIIIANDINFLIPAGVTYKFDDTGELSLNGGDIAFNGPIEIVSGKEGIITQDSVLSDTVFNILGGFTTSTGTLTVNGNGGDNNLVLDLAGATTLPQLIQYNGGSQDAFAPGDILTLQNSDTFDSISYGYVNDTDGNIQLLKGPVLSTIEYKGLEPIYDSLDANDRIFTFSNVTQTITLDDDGALIPNDVSFVDSTTGEIVFFNSPNNSLEINGGSDDDIINLNGLDDNFAADLTVDAKIGTVSKINLTTLTSLVNDLTLTAEYIDVDSNLVSTTGTQTYNGYITDGTANIEFRTTGADQNVIFNEGVNVPLSDIIINATGDIFAYKEFVSNSFILSNGTWQQSIDENISLSSLPVFSANDFTLTGGTFKRFAGGDGSLVAPYEVTDIYGLQGIDSPSEELLDDNYILNNSIDASGTSVWNSGDGFDPIGGFNSYSESYSPFTGTFDGSDGLGGVFVISNLYIDRDSEDSVGLFGAIDSADISNVGLQNVNVIGDANVGGLVGSVIDGNISNAYTTGQVSGDDYVGGLVGCAGETGGFGDCYDSEPELFSGNINIINSYSNANVDGDDAIGGLIGAANYNTKVQNSHATGDISGDDYVGGLLGWVFAVNDIPANGLVISNSYATGDVSGDEYVGGLSGWFGSEDEGIGHAYLISSYATGDVSGDSYVGGLLGRMGSWDVFSSGVKENHVIDSHATGDVFGEEYVGGLVGSVENYLGFDNRIEGSYATGNVEGLYAVGGLIGGSDEGAEEQITPDNRSKVIVNNSYASGDVTGTDGEGDFIGGLIGLGNAIDVSNSYAEGEVSGGNIVGGLIGTSIGSPSDDLVDEQLYNVQIINSYATGDVFGDDIVGGLIGLSERTNVVDSYASGNVDGENYIGGLVGTSNTGNIIETDFDDIFAEGISSSIIQGSYATGDVFGEEYTGGLIGFNENTDLLNTYATGDVFGEDIVGGLIGDNSNSLVTQSYSSGHVYANSDIAGGLVGINQENSHVFSSFSLGSVIGQDGLGGFIGINDNSNITDSYSLGNVYGNSVVGGFIGINTDSNIVNNYSIGTVSNGTESAGFIGDYESGTLLNNYWNTETSGYDATTSGIGNVVGVSGSVFGVNGKTIDEMRAQSTYIGWNFVPGGVWEIKEGNTFPHHQWSEAQPINGVVYTQSYDMVEDALDPSVYAAEPNTDVTISKGGSNLRTLSSYSDTGFYYTILLGAQKTAANEIVQVTAEKPDFYVVDGAAFAQLDDDGLGYVNVYEDTVSLYALSNPFTHSAFYNEAATSSYVFQDDINEVGVQKDYDVISSSFTTYKYDIDGQELALNLGDLRFNGPIELSFGNEGILSQENALDTGTDFELLGGFINNNGTLTVEGNNGDDRLTIGLAGSTILPTEINYSGGNELVSGDDLVLQNGGLFESIVYDYENATDGTINLSNGTTTSEISYEDLEPIYDSLSSTDREFNFGDFDQTITLEYIGEVEDFASDFNRIDSTVGEEVYFEAPTDSILVNGGDLNDVINVLSLSEGFTGDLTIDSQSGSDVVNIDSIPSTVNNLLVESPVINVGANDITTTGFQFYDGSLSSFGNIALTAGDTLSIIGELDIDTDRTLTINANGDIDLLGGFSDSIGNTLVVNGGNGDDELTILTPNGNLPDNIIFDGNDEVSALGDVISISSNVLFDSYTHEITALEDGVISGIDDNGNLFRIQYLDLEPVNINVTAKKEKFDFTNVNQTIVLRDDGDPNNNKSFIDGFGESTVFINPTEELTVVGDFGRDILNIEGLDRRFRADLVANLDSTDKINLMSLPSTVNNLRLIAGEINLSSNNIQTRGSQYYGGKLNSPSTMSLISGDIFTVTGALNISRDKTLSVNARKTIDVLGGFSSSSQGRLEVTGSLIDDRLTIDFQGNNITANGVSYDGQGVGTDNDWLYIRNYVANTVQHNAFDKSSGSIDIDGRLIEYSNLEPIVDYLVTTNRVFNFLSDKAGIPIIGASFLDSALLNITSGDSEDIHFSGNFNFLRIITQELDFEIESTYIQAFNTDNNAVIESELSGPGHAKKRICEFMSNDMIKTSEKEDNKYRYCQLRLEQLKE